MSVEKPFKEMLDDTLDLEVELKIRKLERMMLALVKSKKVANATAEYMHQLYVALQEKGFKSKEALQIISDYRPFKLLDYFK